LKRNELAGQGRRFGRERAIVRAAAGAADLITEADPAFVQAVGAEKKGAEAVRVGHTS
jgi:hypothetical protein